MKCLIVQHKGPGACISTVVEEGGLEQFMLSQGSIPRRRDARSDESHLHEYLRNRTAYVGFAGPLGHTDSSGENYLRYEDSKVFDLLSVD